MSTRFTVDVQGMRQAAAAFRGLPDVAQARLGQAVETTAFQIVQRARANARRRSGTLADALDYAFNAKTGFAKVGVAQVTGDLGERPTHYAHLVEFGHGGPHAAGPHPFMIPAVEAERTSFLQRCQAAGPAMERDLASGGGLL